MYKNLIFGLFAAIFLGLTSCADEKREPENKNNRSEIDSLQVVLEREKKRVDSLEKELHLKIQETEGYPIFFGKKYEEFEDPKAAISEALKQNPGLIPIQPVLGGKMEFRKVNVISEQWLLATYDDGHIQGKAIYEYQLQSNGSFAFTLVTTQEP